MDILEGYEVTRVMNILEGYEVLCSHCEGGKNRKDKDALFGWLGAKWCYQCLGRGTTLTPEGKKLVEFITRHVTCTEGRLIPKKSN